MNKIKLLITFICFLFFLTETNAQASSQTRFQKGYYKKNGTYVNGHYKTKTNKTNHDNYSTIDNTNTFTDNKGYRAKDYTLEANNYGSGKQIRTGPKGGQYYYNDEGKKIYVPKRKG